MADDSLPTTGPWLDLDPLRDPEHEHYWWLTLNPPVAPEHTRFRLGRLEHDLHATAAPAGDDVTITLNRHDYAWLQQICSELGARLDQNLNSTNPSVDYGELLIQLFGLHFGEGRQRIANARKLSRRWRQADILAFFDEHAPYKLERGTRAKLLKLAEDAFPEASEDTLQQAYADWEKSFPGLKPGDLDIPPR